MKFIKFPSIEQYRNVVKKVKDKATFIGLDESGVAKFDPHIKKPTITFTQTVKIHGTNAGVSLTKDGDFGQQSRNRLISVDKDNYGFAMWCNDIERKDCLVNFLQSVLNYYEEDDIEQVTIYGEFAGEGVFNNVAVGQLPKSFYAFSLTLLHSDGETTQLPIDKLSGFKNEDLQLFNILMFENKKVDIDFNEPDEIINSIVEDTNSVENKCPVGEYFNVNGTGEGVVLLSDCGHYSFKSKGEKHAVSKVKTLSRVDTEMMNGVQEFVDSVVTENRLQQGIEYLKEMQHKLSPKSTGVFIKWVIEDIKKEELDTILEKQFDFKVLTHKIGKKSKEFFFNLLDHLEGLK